MVASHAMVLYVEGSVSIGNIGSECCENKY